MLDPLSCLSKQIASDFARDFSRIAWSAAHLSLHTWVRVRSAWPPDKKPIRAFPFDQLAWLERSTKKGEGYVCNPHVVHISSVFRCSGSGRGGWDRRDIPAPAIHSTRQRYSSGNSEWYPRPCAAAAWFGRL